MVQLFACFQEVSPGSLPDAIQATIGCNSSFLQRLPDS